jgi:nicotinamidase/pyrazinamidase
MKALLIVDVLNDFITGTLPVSGAADIVPVINKLQKKFNMIIYIQDFHPANHSSFIAQGGAWPEHCVQGTYGAAFHPDLELNMQGIINIQKGIDKDVDSYSGFYDNEKKHATGIMKHLKGVQEVYICGLATDFCVRATALYAVAEGFKTYVVIDACRAVDINPGDDGRAIMEMIKAGVNIVHSNNI